MVCFLLWTIHCAWLRARLKCLLWRDRKMDAVTLPVWSLFTSTPQRALFLLNQSCRHGETTTDLILWQTACESLSWKPFKRTQHSPLWFGEPSQGNGHTSFLWAQMCRRCPFLPSDCHTELSPIRLSVSPNSGAYLENWVIVFGSSNNTNIFGVAFTCVTSWIWCPLLASWVPAQVWDTHINKNAS